MYYTLLTTILYNVLHSVLHNIPYQTSFLLSIAATLEDCTVPVQCPHNARTVPVVKTYSARTS